MTLCIIHHLSCTLGSVKKYDEMKYFCVVNGKRQESGEKEDSSSCSAYSVGSFELYDFELEFLRNTNCTVDTFDCTVAGGKVPEEIKNSNRFKFHQVCLSRNNARDHQVLTAEEAAIGVPIKAPPGYNRGPYNFSNISYISLNIFNLYQSRIKVQ